MVRRVLARQNVAGPEMATGTGAECGSRSSPRRSTGTSAGAGGRSIRGRTRYLESRVAAEPTPVETQYACPIHCWPVQGALDGCSHCGMALKSMDVPTGDTGPDR